MYDNLSNILWKCKNLLKKEERIHRKPLTTFSLYHKKKIIKISFEVIGFFDDGSKIVNWFMDHYRSCLRATYVSSREIFNLQQKNQYLFPLSIRQYLLMIWKTKVDTFAHIRELLAQTLIIVNNCISAFPNVNIDFKRKHALMHPITF